jgi:hypothetical protein
MPWFEAAGQRARRGISFIAWRFVPFRTCSRAEQIGGGFEFHVP